LFAIKEELPGDVDQPVLDVEYEIGFSHALKQLFNRKGDEIIIKVLPQVLELNYEGRIETASSSGLIEKAEEFPAQFRHFAGGVEILIMVKRTSLGGADLEPLCFV